MGHCCGQCKITFPDKNGMNECSGHCGSRYHFLFILYNDGIPSTMMFEWVLLVVTTQGHLRTTSKRDDLRVAVYSYAFANVNTPDRPTFYDTFEADVDDAGGVGNFTSDFDQRDVAASKFAFETDVILSHLLKTKFMKGASHFFYTNVKKVASDYQSKVGNGGGSDSRWTITVMDPAVVKKFSDKTATALGRVMTKYLKFKQLPSELLDFDYVVHMDANAVASGNYYGTNAPTMQSLQAEVQDAPQACLFFLKHDLRQTVAQEIEKVTDKEVNMENRTSAARWEAHLKEIDFHDSWPLVQIGMFIRKVHCPKVQDAFSEVFDTMISYQLNRDQIVVPVVAPRYLRLGEDVIVIPASSQWGAQKPVGWQWGAHKKEPTEHYRTYISNISTTSNISNITQQQNQHEQ